ncbi:hypothetical protein HWV62_10715 [Athelia sp. TMB]|nr:hypothetical protein HWV62_10715 [Athelia sp. TMB]
MSYFPASSASYKPQIRQEGFHTNISPRPSPPPQYTNGAEHYSTHGYALPDAFRKYPQDNMDFGDELASLIATSPRPAQSPPADEYADGYPRTTHNIFDISAHTTHQQHQQQQPFPAHFSLPAHRPDALSSLGSQPSSLHHAPQHLHDFQAQHAHFNSTLPALNSSLRFDPNPPGPPPPAPDTVAPSSFAYPAGTRHTPSPIGTSRSRSRSRAPSNGPGPTRTARRERRTPSVSSTSPPPLPTRPSAIVIPGRGAGSGVPVSPLSLHSLSSTTSGWFMPPGSAGGEYSLPTPESITNPFFHAHHAQLDAAKVGGKEPPSPGGAGTKESKQALLANEKRRRRRESHNAVERRRRDNINEKISELATLIPECMLDPSAPIAADDPLALSASAGVALPPATPTAERKDAGEDGADGVVKANKGMILRKSVEYIRYLQQLVAAQATRNRELERALRSCGHAHGEGEGAALDFGGLVGMGLEEEELGLGMMEGMHTPTSNESPRPTPPHHAPPQQYHLQMGFGYGLPSMPESEEMRMDARPGTAGSSGGGSGEEEERGRRGRVGGGVRKFEYEEERGMEVQA